MNLKTIFLITFLLCSKLVAYECVPPLLSLGGGYWYAGSRHSGGLAQVEYKFGRRYVTHIRPQAELIIPELRSVFLGVGIAFEFCLKEHFIICPNFSPGLYYRGKGKDLGYPIEFRSAIEFAYEFTSKVRIGMQFYHISNASLSNKNPGANALTGYVAFPLCW